MSQIGLWDESARLEKLSQLGDSLQRLDAAINWEMFRPRLNKVFKKAAKGPGGRPPYDYVLLFKVLVLQRIYRAPLKTPLLALGRIFHPINAL